MFGGNEEKYVKLPANKPELSEFLLSLDIDKVWITDRFFPLALTIGHLVLDLVVVFLHVLVTLVY